MTTEYKPEDIRARRIFSDFDAAHEYAQQMTEHHKTVTAYAGASADESGEIVLPETFGSEAYDIAVLALKKKGSESYTHILVAPLPRASAFLNLSEVNEDVQDYVATIWEKEAAHRIARPVRDVVVAGGNDAAFSAAALEVPTTLEALLAGKSRGSGPLYDGFNALATDLLKQLRKHPQWLSVRITKDDFRRALESAGFAKYYYPQQEADGSFDKLLALMIAKTEATGGQVGIMADWQATRKDKTYNPEADADYDDDGEAVSLEDMFDRI